MKHEIQTGSKQHETLMKCYVDACRFINDRERLRFALTTTLQALGVPSQQIAKIVAEVRANNFSTLNKTIKLNKIIGHYT